MRPIRVLLADDHVLFGAGIRCPVEDRAEIEVVAEAGDGREALALCKAHHPEVAQTDIMMSELDGWTRRHAWRRSRPGHGRSSTSRPGRSRSRGGPRRAGPGRGDAIVASPGGTGSPHPLRMAARRRKR